MTVYYDTLILTELDNTNPPAGVVLNLTTSDSIVLTIDTLDPGDGNNWARVSTPVGCTTSSTSGANGTTTTITPTAGATTYYVIFRTSTEGGFYYGKISGNVTSGNPDTTPNQFTFTDETNVPLSSVRTSTITISGIDTATNISITGGEYSLNGGSTWTSNSGTGTISNGQQIIVRHTSSGSYSTATNTTLTVGGVSDTFTSTTLAADTTPDQFTFTDQTNVPLSSVRTSTITISGINAATNISITGGEYSLNGGTSWSSTSGTGTISNGQQIIVRHTSSGSYSTATNTTLTVGGVSDTFTSTTLAADTTPDAFTFTDQTNVALNSTITSNTITITGLTAPANIYIVNGEYSVQGSAYSATTPATISNEQTITVRHTSASNNLESVDTVLAIGGVSDTFTSTTTSGSGGGPVYLMTPSSSTTRAGRSVTVDLYTDDTATLYWTINTTTSNFAVVQGTTKALIFGVGIFAITPTATCATGSYTVSLRTGSHSGPVVASFSLTVEAALTAATHGMILYDSSGGVLLDTTLDTTRFLGSYTMTTAWTDDTVTPPYVDPPVQTNKGVFVFSTSFVSSNPVWSPTYAIGTDPSGNLPYTANRIYFTARTIPSSGSLIYIYGEY